MAVRQLIFFFLLTVAVAQKGQSDEFDGKPEINNDTAKRVDDLIADMGDKVVYRGHLKSLGSNLTPLKIAERNDFPNPIEFFDDYVKPSKPVVIRGGAKIYPNFDKFTSDNYLSETFPDWEIDVETAKKEDIMKISKAMNMTGFIETYKKKDIYMLSDIDNSAKLADSTYLPKSLLCADFLRGINSCYMQMSSGGTNSYFRRDVFEQLICMYDGSSTFTMANKKYQLYIKLTEESYVDIDVDRVDMKKFPQLSRVPYYQATLNRGDCIYIPYLWYQQIRASNARNLHIGTYFCPILELFSRKGCIKKMKKIPSRAPWAKFKAAEEDISNKKRIIALFAGVQQPFDRQTFFETLFAEMPLGTQLDEGMVGKIFQSIDADGNGLIKFLDIYRADNDILEPLYYIFHGTVRDTVEVATGIQMYSQELLDQVVELKKKTDEQDAQRTAHEESCQADAASYELKQSPKKEEPNQNNKKEEL